MHNCIFCKIVNKEISGEFVGESENFIALKDIKPRAQGHTLIIPKKHYMTLLDIPDAYGNELLEFTKKITNDLLDAHYGDGFNLMMNNLEVAGQVVMHAHIHIIPRKEDDGITLLA